ncbi:MAG TPA: lysozyme [Flavobacteriales bacterium]|nr:lysozyme [Flavobacteriales bacterium]
MSLTATLHTSPLGLQVIRHFEQLHDGNLKKAGLQPKACPAGWWTVGYGHVVVDPVTKKRLGTAVPSNEARALELYPFMSESQAEGLLQKDLRPRENTVDARITAGLTQWQFDALVSLEYNTGAIAANGTIVKLVNAGKMLEAADFFLKWNKGRVNGLLQELKGLTRRRKCERELFLTGKVNLFQK